MKWPSSTTCELDARVWDQQQRFNHENSSGRWEKQSHESWRFLKRISQLNEGTKFRGQQNWPTHPWANICQIMDFSFIDLRIPLCIYAFPEWGCNTDNKVSRIFGDHVSDFFFSLWTHSHLFILFLSMPTIASLHRGKNLPNECPGYDTKQSEVPVMLELWGMWSTPSLPLLPGPLWSGMVAPDRVLSMGQIELNCVLMLNWISWNRTVSTFKLCTYAKLNCLK